MHPGLLVIGGFLLGTVGVKAAKSRPVHQVCVRAAACGLECKGYVEHVVDEAKAQCDDIMAEAKALRAEEDAAHDVDDTIIEEAAEESKEPEE
ncbi:DUF6110 family protein [Xiamenia xianingshaonis]|uniref:DUF1490 family protein n=1 Tax=Xiamenia xianingshaonis TaxID=2682776 RepID=A0ABX0IPG2_9ACTN|nr:DUF6110 family protein [Xiamenia xianingshaonis]NHM14747.1 DUF1490 family protein [Xiamenia xianingshaonis]